MYRCPRCHAELSADARFCKNCGFNATNARLAAVPPPVQGVPQAPPMLPQQGVQQIPTRTIQPQHKYVPQQTPPQQAQTVFQGRPNVPQQAMPGSLPNTPHPQPMNAPQQPRQAAPVPQQNIVPQANRNPQPHVQNGYVPPAPPSNRVQQAPVMLQGNLVRSPNQWSSEQVVRTSTPPLKQYTPPVRTNFEPLQWSLGTPAEVSGNAESLAATSKAAQHWRQSWLDRQRAEAGPAVDVSRGQAAVPEPLMVMQNSLARMRAIILPKRSVQGKNGRLMYWLSVILLVCLIGGLGAYLLSTYSGGLLGTPPVSANTSAEPTLTWKGAKTSVAAGQAINVHGDHFGANNTIYFYLDDTAINGANGKQVSIQSSDKGTFDISLTIPSTQLTGEYALQARDAGTGRHAFLPIRTVGGDTTNVLKPSVPALTFNAIVRQNNPNGQTVTISNTSNAAIQWSASAISDNQGGWLLLTNGKTSGQLEAGATDKIRVDVATQGLTTTPTVHSYTGEIVFTIANQGQVTLPVKLNLSNTTAGVIISPNPLIAVQSSPGSCQPDTSITLINLSNGPIDWNVQTNGLSRGAILLDGKQEEGGQLDPSGYPNDTKVIRVGCIGMQLNKQYDVNVFYNGSQQVIPVSLANG